MNAALHQSRTPDRAGRDKAAHSAKAAEMAAMLQKERGQFASARDLWRNAAAFRRALGDEESAAFCEGQAEACGRNLQ